MSVTIFCTFDQQDLADLAMGKLRVAVAGIKSIHYLAGYRNQEDTQYGVIGALNVWGGYYAGAQAVTEYAPSRPVTVKIVCADTVCDTVVSKLVNMHAHQIITTR